MFVDFGKWFEHKINSNDVMISNDKKKLRIKNVYEKIYLIFYKDKTYILSNKLDYFTYEYKVVDLKTILGGRVNMLDFLKGNKYLFMLIGGVSAFIMLLMLLLSVYTIGPGYRGIVTTFGKVEPTVLGEGIHFVIPVMQKVVKMDTKIFKSQTEASAASKDLQEVHSVIALNYHILPQKANIVYQQIGDFYKERIIDPIVQESLKAITAKYVAVDLIQQREKVSQESRDLIKSRLLEYNIIVDGFNIVNFAFSKNFTESVEAKQTAEQQALKAKNDLERIKTEAQQKVETARAEAEALRLQRQNITTELVELRKVEANIQAIKKWDGKLPDVVGGAIPFVNVTSSK